jgi:hypothetical protein
MKQLSLLLYCITLSFFATAQDYGNLKFGNVNVSDLSVTSYSVDSSASAVVLSDICRWSNLY